MGFPLESGCGAMNLPVSYLAVAVCIEMLLLYYNNGKSLFLQAGYNGYRLNSPMSSGGL
jgi:hypothetical protein